MFSLSLFILALASVACASIAALMPSKDDVVVCQPPRTCNYRTISDALAALPAAARSIFVYPGVYKEQVVINRSYPTTIQGYTLDRYTYLANQVTISNNLSAQVVGSNELSGTVRAESANITLYNLNIENTFGHYAAGCQCQAIALSAQGERGGFYGINTTSYQDTLLANRGAQIYAKSRIAGAIDFIFGQYSPAYFYKSNIEATEPGNLTAPGALTDNSTQVYVFDQCHVIPSHDATPNTTGNVFLGRPWKPFGRSVFRNSYLGPHIDPAGWNIWSAATPNVDESVLGEYANFGPGADTRHRANFTKLLSAEEARNFTIDILGANWKDWVDTSFLF